MLDNFPDAPVEIPKQRLPGWIRWPIRLYLLPFILLDLAMQKVAKWLVPPPYKREGQYLKRGECCRFIMLRKAKGLRGRLFYLWFTEIQGFFPKTQEEHEYEGKSVYVMGCRYLQKDGSCKHYRLRPMVCRKWPVIEHFGQPRILKGCGFKAVPRKSASRSTE